jgi:hypothetical protein
MKKSTLPMYRILQLVGMFMLFLSLREINGYEEFFYPLFLISGSILLGIGVNIKLHFLQLIGGVMLFFAILNSNAYKEYSVHLIVLAGAILLAFGIRAEQIARKTEE